MKRGKDGILLPDGRAMKSLSCRGTCYKYLGVWHANEVKQKEMKEKVTKEYKRRVRKLLETKLNGGNLIRSINTWAIPVIRYSSPFLDWTIEEMREMDRSTRKLFTMHNRLHPRSNAQRLYISRSEGGRGLASVEDTILAGLDLERYIEQNDEKLIIAARGLYDLRSESEQQYRD